MNAEKILEAIRRKGLKKKYIAEVLGISYQAFLNKMSGRTDFLLTEIQLMSSILSLSEEERLEIFFANNVD